MAKHWVVLTLSTCWLMGCAGLTTEPRPANPWLVDVVSDMAIRNAILQQHTLYPYHFVQNSSQLNELGQRDVAVLASFFKENPGPLYVRHGNEPVGMYSARLLVVSEVLAKAGVDSQRIVLQDALPGGDGATSDRVLNVLKRAEGTDKGKNADDTSYQITPIAQ